MLFNDEKTRLQKGDTIAYNKETAILMFLRNKQPLSFSNSSIQALFFMPNLNFLVFIKILAETNGLDSPPISEIQPFPIIIGKREYLHYIF